MVNSYLLLSIVIVQGMRHHRGKSTRSPATIDLRPATRTPAGRGQAPATT